MNQCFGCPMEVSSRVEEQDSIVLRQTETTVMEDEDLSERGKNMEEIS